jgi:hypothetical protein
MRTIIAATIALLTVTAAHAEGCTRNHELYKIVPEYRAVLLDGGDIKRGMNVDMKDERLSTWKPGHNITFCPDENKMINTTINSIVTLVSEFLTTCNTRILSNSIDYALEKTWEYTNQQNGIPSMMLAEVLPLRTSVSFLVTRATPNSGHVRCN